MRAATLGNLGVDVNVREAVSDAADDRVTKRCAPLIAVPVTA
jgi:hypothetical protein